LQTGSERRWRTAAYCRLSREDGDRVESDSIGNQKKLLQEYIGAHPELEQYDFYIDDGYTGTNFDRPDFQRMLGDIEAGHADCILVKDLSRFGRDYIEAGRYLERWLPAHGARFIAVTDGIDSLRGGYDLMVPLKNLFNTQYALDISHKVKSALEAKQRRGEFIGAFASYGYLRDPENHNRLIIDPAASEVVRRIFSLFENGAGKIRIAKVLNEERIPCPSEYKRLMGERYHNANRLPETSYWTYATINRILKSEVYIGSMEQGRDERTQMHGPAKRKAKDDWIVVPGTHEPIIEKGQWDRVQALLEKGARQPDFSENVSPFAGFLKCGDCGRAMAKTSYGGRIFYTCGSFKRYGGSVCSRHYITQETFEQIVLSDLNRIIASIENLRELAEKEQSALLKMNGHKAETQRTDAALARVRRLKKGAYEDYREGLLSKDDYLRYRADYEAQEEKLTAQLLARSESAKQEDLPARTWIDALLHCSCLTTLDRPTLAETVKEIRVFEDGSLEIRYLFSEELRALLEK